MNIRPSISKIDNLSGWLLTVLLLFSISTFSGLNSNYTQQQQVFTTEIVTETSFVTPKTAFFNSIFKKLYPKVVISIPPPFVIKQALIAFNLLSKTLLDWNAKLMLNMEMIEKFFQKRRISQSLEEDLPFLFRG